MYRFDGFYILKGFKSVTILSKSKHNRFGTILHADRVNINQLGGKIVVSGIGDVDEDEFFLSLLNEQVRMNY